MWIYFNETCHNYLLPGPCDTDDIFKVMCSGSRSLTTFPRNAVSWQRHTDLQFAVEGHLDCKYHMKISPGTASDWQLQDRSCGSLRSLNE